MPTMLLAAVIGALIGLSLGTLGGGGSILTVPALVYLLGQDPHGAVGSSLMIVGTNALLGAWLHLFCRAQIQRRRSLIATTCAWPVTPGEHHSTDNECAQADKLGDPQAARATAIQRVCADAQTIGT